MLVGNQGVKVVVLPGTIDPQIGSQKPFALKSGFFKQTTRTIVFGDTGSFDPVQSKRIETERNDETKRLLHEAAAGVALSHPVADLRRLGHATADIADGYAAGEI